MFLITLQGTWETSLCVGTVDLKNACDARKELCGDSISYFRLLVLWSLEVKSHKWSWKIQCLLCIVNPRLKSCEGLSWCVNLDGHSHLWRFFSFSKTEDWMRLQSCNAGTGDHGFERRLRLGSPLLKQNIATMVLERWVISLDLLCYASLSM
jgi:hypothetical protein